jgi:hypothetical protein
MALTETEVTGVEGTEPAEDDEDSAPRVDDNND